jgi:hypothetical protein
MSNLDDPVGEFGGGSRRMQDARLVERALKEGWPIPAEIRGLIVKRLGAIALDDHSSPREAVAAARAVLQASKINLDAVAAAIKAREHEDLVERVSELEQRLADPGGGR